MLALPHTNSWGFVYANQANGGITPGTAIAPGASDVEGSWTEIAGDADITSEIQLVELLISNGASAGQSKQHLLDFGWDAAGGTSYVAFFSDLACGGSLNTSTFSSLSGVPIVFPCKIPAGSAIAVRIQGSNATAGFARVLGRFYGKPSRPELWRTAAYTETLGYTSGTLGTSFTPGNAGWGSWASLGTTTKKHFHAQLGVQVDNGTNAAVALRFQLAIGDGTNMHVISDFMGFSGGNETISLERQLGAWEIPSGAEIYVRANASGSPASGYNATAVLFGG